MPTARRPIGAKDAGTPAPAPEKNPKAARTCRPPNRFPPPRRARGRADRARAVAGDGRPGRHAIPRLPGWLQRRPERHRHRERQLRGRLRRGPGRRRRQSAEPAAAPRPPRRASRRRPTRDRDRIAQGVRRRQGLLHGPARGQRHDGGRLPARCGLLAERLKAAESRAIAAEERAAKAERALDAETASPAPVRTAGREANADPTASSFEKIEDSKERAKAEWAADFGGCKKSFVERGRLRRVPKRRPARRRHGPQAGPRPDRPPGPRSLNPQTRRDSRPP
jgi:hypothetical protein